MAAEAKLGIPQLDALLAPLPAHATVLFENDPGVDPDPFIAQIVAHHLKSGGKVAYLVTNRGPATALGSLAALGVDPAGVGDRLVFVDAFSPLMGSAVEGAIPVSEPSNAAALAAALETAARTVGSDGLLAVDALSTLADTGTPEAFATAAPSLARAMKGFGLAAVGFTRWPYGADVEAALGAFDAVVRLKGVEERVVFSQFFSVERAAWKPAADTKPRLYKVIKPGGVVVYIPKILVTGPYNAGKSSFIHAVSDTAVSVDRLGTTVALDHGHVTLDGLAADIFGTPGQSRFDPILRTVAGQALGVIVVVDSTKPESFPRAKEMMTYTWKQGLPAVIAANKQDLPDALPPDEVARLVDAPGAVKVVGCEGQDRESSRRVLRELIDQILAGGMTR